MGWWSTDILGGDSPLDYLCDIQCELGLNEDESLYPIEDLTDEAKTKLRSAIETKGLDNLIDKIVEVHNLDDTEYFHIHMQVLALVCTTVGAPIDENQMEVFKTAFVLDVWAKEDEERKQVMDDFLKVLEDYDDSPTEPPYQKGLFEKFAEVLDPSPLQDVLNRQERDLLATAVRDEIELLRERNYDQEWTEIRIEEYKTIAKKLKLEID